MSNKIGIAATAEEAEDCQYVVCKELTDPLMFSDNMVGVCCRCGGGVQFRPHGPTIPPKICLPCILPEMEAEAKKGEMNVMITPKTAQEVREHLQRKKLH